MISFLKNKLFEVLKTIFIIHILFIHVDLISSETYVGGRRKMIENPLPTGVQAHHSSTQEFSTKNDQSHSNSFHQTSQRQNSSRQSISHLHQISWKKNSNDFIYGSQFSGSYVVIINIATQCGYTSQLKKLQELYVQFKDQSIAFLGLPTNDFGGQSPESDEEIQAICQRQYDVSFPITAKVSVHSPTDPFFELLNHLKIPHPRWNFFKYVFDPQGHFLKSFSSGEIESLRDYLKTLKPLSR
jgi:glutathione peroxidase